MASFTPLIPLNFGSLSDEACIQLAIEQIRLSGTKSDGHPVYSIRRAAEDFGIPRSTLCARYHGRKTRRKAHEAECLLSDSQEDVLVEWIKTMGHRGIPMTADTVREYVADVIGKPVGENWVNRFKVSLFIFC
jgi:hypothetical protein